MRTGENYERVRQKERDFDRSRGSSAVVYNALIVTPRPAYAFMPCCPSAVGSCIVSAPHCMATDISVCRLCAVLLNVLSFYGEELLALRPIPELEDHPLSVVCDCLFSIFAATLHIGNSSSIRNLRMHSAVMAEGGRRTESVAD